MAKKVYKTTRKYQCPYCDKKLPRIELIDHVMNKHESLIPEDYTATRVVFDSINKTDHGTCMICRKPVYEWNEKTSRYNNICSEACRKEVRRIALERHIKTYNAPTLLTDPEHQEKMLANRHISGKYKHSDGAVITYTGKYEKATLEFMDKVMNIPSTDIQMPGPILEYEYKGETHRWITDIYYIPANLIIEVKDGGDNPNKRNMPEYRGKQHAKELMITELGKFNYLRLTNNNFSQLLEALAEIKYENMDQSDSPKISFYINESTSMNESIPGGLPPHRHSTDSSTWIEPCMMRNTFVPSIAIGNDDDERVYVYDDEFSDKPHVMIKEDYKRDYTTTSDTLVCISKDSTNRFRDLMRNNLTLNEALNTIAGYRIRTLDELALQPNWFMINKQDETIKNRLIMTGIIRENDILSGKIKLHDVDNAPLKGHVFLARSNNGYYVHTADDYYLASDYYDSPEDIPQNIIDLMNDLYTQNRGKKDGE